MSAKPTREQADVEGLMEQFREYMARRRLKSTRQRDSIARTFFASTGHLTIEDLLVKVRVREPRVGYATVYRTLKLLTECGLAAARHFTDGQATFEIAGDTGHHDHLICLDCHHVLEFENDEIERLQEQVARSFGFSLVRHRLELYGLCAKARGIRGGSCPHEDERKPSAGESARAGAREFAPRAAPRGAAGEAEAVVEEGS